jgi:hypothetical protein
VTCSQHFNSCLQENYNSYESRNKNVYLLSWRCVLISAIRLCTFQVRGVQCGRTCESILIRSFLTSGFRDVRTNARHSNCSPSLRCNSLASVVLPTPPGPTMETTLSLCSPSLPSHSSTLLTCSLIPTGSLYGVGCQEPKDVVVEPVVVCQRTAS